LPQGKTCFVPGDNATYAGYVTNCGDINLTNVIVNDSRTGRLTLLDPVTGLPISTNPNGGINLAVGTIANYTTSYTPSPAEFCSGSTSNFVSATGTDTSDIGGPNASVTNSTSATCPLCVTPCISVTKNCTGPVGVGNPQTVSGVVSNCGNITLTNITLNDNVLGPITNITQLTPGQSVNYSTTFTAGCNSFTNTVTASGTSTCGQGVSATATAPCFVTSTPCIKVTLNCPGPVVVGDPQTISGSVSNCGTITLTNVVVTDDVFGAITNISQLGSGQSVSYSRTFTSSCSGFTNSITATGTSICGQTVQSTATAPCLVTQTPCIKVTKNCTPNSVQVGGMVAFTGVVTNCGNVALTNVILTDTFLGGVIATIPRLEKGGAAGSSSTYSNSYTATLGDCNRGSVTNTVIATGLDACDGRQVQSTASCSFGVQCQPCLGVTKEVACYYGSNTCGTFGKFAVGVESDSGEPAFCYRITITNCSQNVTLTNVTVIDSIYGNLTADFPCIVSGVLPPLTGCTYVFRASVGTKNDTTTFVTNVVTLTGTPPSTGVPTNAVDHAAVEVIPAKVTCTKFYTLDGGPPTNNVKLSDQNTHTIVWYVTIANVGVANLGDVTVTDVGLPCAASYGPFPLDQGASITFAVCTNDSFICTNKGLENTITIMNDQFSMGTNHLPVCSLDIHGSNIVASSECSAIISCVRPPSCRVTGGGRQDDPIVYPDNVRYVTHGGQVGAPVGNKVCVVTEQFFLGNPCIHGRWTHVRHMQGGLEGNFHARYYDTLDCACLDTNYTPATVTVPGVDGVGPQTYVNLVYGPATVVDEVCGNRNIGPLPRPAGANKIVFTGVGDWADPNGRRAPRSVLFRVDIEDRGEPGNAHALSADKKPGRVPDRYRIRIWVLSDQEKAELNGSGPDKYLLNFRNAISACFGINVQDGASVPNGTAAFGVRAPDVDDGGELLHGNHQIHPSIRDCDPENPQAPPVPKPDVITTDQ
jgi:uncharacterized repeat protein (TIGR01451 family)